MNSISIPLVDLRVQMEALRPELDAAWADALARSDFILGAALDTFEREFAAYCECPCAIGVASGLDALKLILRALEIGPGDEVIVPANTFIATALAVSAVGATPVLADCEDRTYGMDPDAAIAAITPRTRAFLPVHLYGHPARMQPLLDAAGRHGLEVVEDAAQAHGARLTGRRCGSLGRAAAFSFYPAKNLGALGDGGAVTTRDPDLAARIASLRNYGSTVKYHHAERGENSRLDTLQAAILSVKLRRLDEGNRQRRSLAARYTEGLRDLPGLVLPFTEANSEPVYHQYVIRSARRDEVLRALLAAGIGCGIHYPIPIHLQPAYADAGWKRGQFPVAERCADEALSLPMYPELTEKQVDQVIRAVRQAV